MSHFLTSLLILPFQGTKENLIDAAKTCGLNDELLSILKIRLPADYQYHFRLTEEKKENKSKSKSDTKGSEVQEHRVFKYSTDYPLAEQIKLGEEYVFLQIIGGKPVISRKIDLSKIKKMVLYPSENTPILDFQYENEEEIKDLIEVAKTKTIDDLYFESKALWGNFVKATDEQIILFTADSIFTFFQDMFVTTHYTMLVARVGSGKGAVLITLSYLGYRVILGANMSGASILDLLGSVEMGQVVIAEDELNSIKSDSDKWRLYTIGYDAFGLTTKTLDGSTSSRKVVYYFAYGYKMFGGETSLDTTGLEGLLDRMGKENLMKGKPKFYIKNLRKTKRSPEYEELLQRIMSFRKAMLIYRLLHANDLFEEVRTNIDGRALELVGPTIDLFYALSEKRTALEEILPVLSSFLRRKGDLAKENNEIDTQSSLHDNNLLKP